MCLPFWLLHLGQGKLVVEGVATGIALVFLLTLLMLDVAVTECDRDDRLLRADEGREDGRLSE